MIRKEAMEIQSQGFNCAETVIKLTGKYYIGDIGIDFGRLVTGYGGGIGRSREEACGALTGCVTALSILFGREDPSVSVDPIHEKVSRFRDMFIEKFGQTNCGLLREGLEPDDAKKMCHNMTADTVVMFFEYLEKLGAVKVKDF